MNDKDKEIFIKFGQNIQQLRKERNMTIQELSKLTGIRTQYLRKIESGKAYGMGAECIFIFADAFNIKPHEVVRGM